MGYVEKDFLMRQFNQLGVVLARILGLKEKGKFEEAKVVINNSLSDFGLKEIELYLSIEKDTFLSELMSYRLTHDQIVTLAELLYENAEIYVKIDKIESAREMYHRALILFEYITEMEKVFSFEREARINRLKLILKD